MINQSLYLEINGQKQFLSIRSQSPNLPILLYIHGGPGDTALPLMNKYNYPLENKFIFVIWEQRGAGKSYYPFKEDEHPTMQTFVDDIFYIVTYLLKQFKQEKVFLLGHSWGSALGLKFIQQHPQLVDTYIGCGQVVDMNEGFQSQYNFVKLKNKEKKNKRALKRLSEIELSLTQDNWLDDLLYVTKQVVKYKGSLYGKSNYNKLINGFIFSNDYNIKDLINRDKGSLQSLKYLWPELMSISFKDVKSFEVPIVFIEGRHDYHVSSVLAKKYFDSITTAKKFYWFEQSCHFPQWSEAEKFNQVVSSLVH